MTLSDPTEFTQPSPSQTRLQGTPFPVVPRVSHKRKKPSSTDLKLSGSSASVFTEAVCIDLMTLALQRSVNIDCILDTEAIRRCFYRARKKCQLRGDHRFDRLTFQAEGFFLLAYLRLPGTPRLHGGMKIVREGVRFCVNRHGLVRQW